MMKELRVNAGLTQRDAARALNVRQSTISMWESGANHPPARKLAGIAALYGVPIEKVLRASYPCEGGGDSNETVSENS